MFTKKKIERERILISELLGSDYAKGTKEKLRSKTWTYDQVKRALQNAGLISDNTGVINTIKTAIEVSRTHYTDHQQGFRFSVHLKEDRTYGYSLEQVIKL